MTVQSNPPATAQVKDLKVLLEGASVGDEILEFVADLYPICRSITGDGVRQTLRAVARQVPLAVHEVPTGTPVLDWTVPKEWNIRDAYIQNARGDRVVDFRRSNLHVVSYSVPVNARMTLAELRDHLFTLPERPEWIPYRTSYYQETWGFCLSHAQLQALDDGPFDVRIDSSLEPGSLTYGELLLPGRRSEEVLVSTHICHPSLCNDNLSGLAVSTFLAKILGAADRRYSYRFLFIPGTIGAITWLARNEDRLHLIQHGLVLTGLGAPGPFTYKRSRRGRAEIDRTVAHVLASSGRPCQVVDFSPYGYDERQYCSPGFDLPVGVLSRTPHGQYPEYHTSADNLEFIKGSELAESLRMVLRVIEVLEGNIRYLNVNPKGEPQLGRRGLYRAVGGGADPGRMQMAMLWVLNQSDGTHSLLEVAERAGMPFETIRDAADVLVAHGLLVRHPGGAA